MLIASALWGVLRPEDRIPYYRFSAKARLDRIGPPPAFWRRPLAEALPDEEGALVVDMRSGAYAAAWKPQRATLLAVAPSPRGGKRKPVTHMAKAVRGEVAKALLEAKKAPEDPEVAAAIAERGRLRVELDRPPRRDRQRLRSAGASVPGRRRGRAGAGSGPRRRPGPRSSRGWRSRLALGSSGHGVRTTAATSRPAARAASIVSRVWLIVPRPGRATTTSGRPRSTARSRTR